MTHGISGNGRRLSRLRLGLAGVLAWIERAEELEHALLLLALLAEGVSAGLRAEFLVPGQRAERGAHAPERTLTTTTGDHENFLRRWKAASSASSAQNSEQNHCPVCERHNWARPSTVWNGELQNAQLLGASVCRWPDVTSMVHLTNQNLTCVALKPDSPGRRDS
jgi:hypothetical protein